MSPASSAPMNANHTGENPMTATAVMTYDEMFEHLTTTLAMPDMVARNLLLDAFKGQSAWFGGSQSPYRVVRDRGASRQDGYQILADGYVIREDPAVAATSSLRNMIARAAQTPEG